MNQVCSVASSIALSFRKDVSLFEISEDYVIIQTPSIRLNLKPLSMGLIGALKSLYNDRITEESLNDIVIQTDGFAALPKLYYYLEKFISLGIICHTVSCEHNPLATVIPILPTYKLEFKKLDLDTKYMLSRFAYCHQDKEQMILESPLSPVQLVLHDWRGGAIFTELAKAKSCREISGKLPNVLENALQILLGLLLSGEFISEVKEEDNFEFKERRSLQMWEFHDLLFHSKTRKGRTLNPVGKTFHWVDKIDSPPVIKPEMSRDKIDLYKPDLEKLKQEDTPFTLVLENRKTIRNHGTKPITDRQLGEFLYRCARVKEIFPKDYRESSSRPYAGGGGCYELELYLAISSCENITPGFYHYCPQVHQLEQISDMKSDVKMLLKDAQISTRPQCYPQILIIVAARFARVNWVYESMAYGLILKNVGTLFQTMYLVATAMNLAPIAVGAGDLDLFASVSGNDYYTESSVGEFILGSKAD